MFSTVLYLEEGMRQQDFLFFINLPFVVLGTDGEGFELWDTEQEGEGRTDSDYTVFFLSAYWVSKMPRQIRDRNKP